MSQDFDMFSEAVHIGKRTVVAQDNTEHEVDVATQESFENGVDQLFGSRPSYQLLKKERPEHRLILWRKLQGQTTKEIASQMSLSEVTVRNVCKQPWFIENFCRQAKELGSDVVQTYLKGEVMPALVRTVALAEDSKIDTVRLAANREILDRFLGKSVVRAEVKSTSHATLEIVHDVAALQEEERKLNEQLRAVGIPISPRS